VNRSAALVALAAILVTALTARLGFWQLDRAAQKLARHALITERAEQPDVPGAALGVGGASLDELQYRHTTVQGHWVPGATWYLDNRPMAQRVGFVVLSALRLDDGSALLVQRGWLPRDFLERTRVRAPDLPAGPVSVRGRIAPPPARLYEFSQEASGPIRQNVDIQMLSAESGLRLRPMSLQQLTSPGPDDGLLRDWPLPAADVQKHYGYAFQWFAMSALTIFLYVWFQLVKPRRRRA
jgi:surfeit locus 1 family protein